VERHDLPGREEVQAACRMLGAPCPEGFFQGLHRYLDLLSDCSGRMNLVGPGELGRLWGRHAMESLAYAAYLEDGPVVDIGSGAGFPGFVLALLGFQVTMVEPREKRCGFLETAARECGLRNARVVRGRIEESGPFDPGTQFVARAVRKPAEMMPMIRSCAKGSFTFLIRVQDSEMAREEGCTVYELPSPPLDRRGFLLQYSHSVQQNRERCTR
jgi:16S rRNA (guanine(527)-N(7))-methyltransferase RsmG